MNKRTQLFVVKLVAFTIAALLIITGLAYFMSNSRDDSFCDMKCEEAYTGDIIISSIKANNNKERIRVNIDKMARKMNRVINEKYPKEFIIRINSDDGVMEEVEEEPDEYDSARCINLLL